MLIRLFYLILIYLFLAASNVKAEESKTEILLLQCGKPKELIHNRLTNIDYELTNVDKWKINKTEGFYFIVFGTDWEEVEETCYAHEAYIEIAQYTTTIPYTDKIECLNGVYGRGTINSRDSWGSYFQREYLNNYVTSKNTCNVKANYTFVENTAHRIDRSARHNCKLAKDHFYNLISDPAYGKSGADIEWQKQRCKIITQEKFEIKTGLYVKELKEVLAGEII